MRQAIIMSGISGSGKSTEIDRRFPNGVVKPMLEKVDLSNKDSFFTNRAVVVSSDHYFMNEQGLYVFNPAHLGLAHGACLRNFMKACQELLPHVVVDNTNTTNEELAPYIAVALAYDYKVEVVTLMCANMQEAMMVGDRNTHRVPIQGITSQHERLLRRKPPFHWQPQFGVTFTQLPVILETAKVG